MFLFRGKVAQSGCLRNATHGFFLAETRRYAPPATTFLWQARFGLPLGRRGSAGGFVSGSLANTFIPEIELRRRGFPPWLAEAAAANIVLLQACALFFLSSALLIG